MTVRFPVFLSMKGCRGRCVYCDQRAITGQTPPSPDQIREDIRRFSRKFAGKIDEICLFGGSFTCLPRKTQEEYLAISKELDIQTRFSTHPMCVDSDTLDFLSDYPISMIELGISSLDDRTLSLCRRGYSSEEALFVMKKILDFGYSLCAQMMIGLPGQTVESSLRDLKALSDLKGQRDMTLRIYPCLVLKGSPLQAMMDQGYRPLSVEEGIMWGAKMFLWAKRYGFKVQRIGLSETPSLAEAVAGGPHHPALGELIKGEALARTLAAENPEGPWRLDRKDISLLTGHGARGLRRLGELRGISKEEAKRRIVFEGFPVD